MTAEISRKEVIGNELSFPVPGNRKPGLQINARKLIIIFLSGYALIAGVIMGIRAAFFINAGYATGIVTGIKKSSRGYSFDPHVAFTADDGTQVTFKAAQNLRLDRGEQVKVIYKRDKPQRAAVYSFFGFWFNSILVCQVLAMFWVGLLVVYYGDYP